MSDLYEIIVSALIVLLSAFFWNQQNTTSKRIEKVEKDFSLKVKEITENYERDLHEIRRDIREINQKLDVGSGVERPIFACREYFNSGMKEMKEELKQTIISTIQAQLYVETKHDK